MLPPAIKCVRDLIYWQYAKIISDSAGMGKKNKVSNMAEQEKLERSFTPEQME